MRLKKDIVLKILSVFIIIILITLIASMNITSSKLKDIVELRFENDLLTNKTEDVLLIDYDELKNYYNPINEKEYKILKKIEKKLNTIRAMKEDIYRDKDDVFIFKTSRDMVDVGSKVVNFKIKKELQQKLIELEKHRIELYILKGINPLEKDSDLTLKIAEKDWENLRNIQILNEEEVISIELEIAIMILLYGSIIMFIMFTIFSIIEYR